MHEVAGLEPGPEIAPDFDDHEWSNVWVSKLESNNLEAGHTAVFRRRPWSWRRDNWTRRV